MTIDGWGLLLLVQAAASLYLMGLCWFVQVVHYPLMARVDVAAFPAYETEHRSRTVWVTLPAMLVELVSAWTLVAVAGSGLPGWQINAGAGLATWIWLQTLGVHLPQHFRLAQGFDAATHSALVRLNAIRTLCWTLRGGLALLMLATFWRISAQS